MKRSDSDNLTALNVDGTLTTTTEQAPEGEGFNYRFIRFHVYLLAISTRHVVRSPLEY